MALRRNNQSATCLLTVEKSAFESLQLILLLLSLLLLLLLSLLWLLLLFIVALAHTPPSIHTLTCTTGGEFVAPLTLCFHITSRSAHACSRAAPTRAMQQFLAVAGYR